MKDPSPNMCKLNKQIQTLARHMCINQINLDVFIWRDQRKNLYKYYLNFFKEFPCIIMCLLYCKTEKQTVKNEQNNI